MKNENENQKNIETIASEVKFSTSSAPKKKKIVKLVEHDDYWS